MTPRIEARGVGKVFAPARRHQSPFTALQAVDLAIGEGEIVAVVGPSGCGKTTILKLIAGFDAPTSGTLLMDGRGLGRPGPDRSVVFQSPALFDWLTVHDNVVFGPRHRGEPKADYLARARELIEAVGLASWERHYPYQLSGGMRQRVQLARALINRPAVLLMDEPFGALDAQTRARMQELLLRIWLTYHSTVLFVTHDVEEALLLSHRVYVMTRAPGRIKTSITVPFDHPRGVDLVGTADFAALKYSILKSLWEELS
ncbi:MAG TPA: ABC transporter ATP-binding protein [Methylomirabilota bacterium]|jgi:NitT/TauT family transport system ATP-binding protein|nr:ABC transporter ATP-binding protein [Methylomirabilota bacterium]HEV8615244.1 ABC transporter ATP-binding protein [Methylomirabilota bacterium]